MNLDRAGVMPRVDVVQGDANTREIQFSLFSGGQAWEVPTDAQVLVRYKKANGAGGTYDTMSDGAAAAVVSGNTVTVTLAPQALSADGSVSLAVTLAKGDAELSTFAVQLNVMKNPTAATDDDGNYVSVSGLLPKPDSADVGQYLEVAAVDQNGKIKELKAVDAPSGGVSDEQIANAVAEYMKANPSTVGASIYYTTVTLSDEMAESVYPFMYTDLVPSDRIPKVGDLIIDPKNRLYKIADVYGDPDFTADAAWVATLSKDGTGGSSVQPDWNQNDETAADYVKNRTHYEEGSQTVIEWDGNTEGRDSIGTGAGTFYKVSDLTPDKTDILGGTFTVVYNGTTEVVEIGESNIDVVDNGLFITGCVIVIVESETIVYDDTEIIFPSTGMYFAVLDNNARISSITYGSTTIHPLDEKFIPESIARKTATLPMPTTASVGQYIVVSAVDESGKVTATEAVTMEVESLEDAEGVAF
jgi:hypothetical protein